MRFVEEQTEVGENDPEFLPAVAVLELPQQVSRELVLAQNKKKTTVKPEVAILQKKMKADTDEKPEAACRNCSCTCSPLVKGLPDISHGDRVTLYLQLTNSQLSCYGQISDFSPPCLYV